MSYQRSSFDSQSARGLPRPVRNRSHSRTQFDGTIHRRDSNLSNMSAVSDVEMAQDEIYDGPLSASVPSSVTGFTNRRQRSESTATWTFYSEVDELLESDNEEAIADGTEHDPDDVSHLDGIDELHSDSVRPSLEHRGSYDFRPSAELPLLERHSSSKTGTSAFFQKPSRTQKLYLASEDLEIVLAGFRTHRIRFVFYLCLCIFSLGLGYLVFRWVPRWRVRLIGVRTPLRDCEWVVIENVHGEMSVINRGRLPFERASTTLFRTEKDRSQYYESGETNEPLEICILDYRYIRFIFDPWTDKFVVCSNWTDPEWRTLEALRTGLSNDERNRREDVFGRNQIDIQDKSIPQLLTEEVLHPFYMFQIASLVLWSLDQYYYYATCIFLISIVSITTTLIETRATMRRMKDISRFECAVRVLRKGFWSQVSSARLVPGDVYEISDPSLSQFPCDSLLLTGDCIVNESMLTGESVPVAKMPAVLESLDLLKDSANSMHPELAKHFLFNGTKIIRARKPQEGADDEAAALAMVVRTGFDTTKGALVRSMLFPKPSGFNFYHDAFRYIRFMAMIAGIGFIASLINFIRLRLAWHLIIVRALDLITIVVPPALPATLTIGTSFALSRLKERKIFCISPTKVNVGGKVDVMCFDKTGTLTEDGLDILGVRVVMPRQSQFSEVLSDFHSLLPGAAYERDPVVDYTVHQALLYTMATCHSLRSVDGQLLGDPLDVKMFEFTGWDFEERSQSSNTEDSDYPVEPSSIARPPAGFDPRIGVQETHESGNFELHTLKSFDFISQLRRASVIVGQLGIKRGVEVFVKGAPESLREICHPKTIPPDYDNLLSTYTNRGFRVIACAAKSIKLAKWSQIRRITRDEAESKLSFLGFIIFENKLKQATWDIINEINDARIRNVMCTGDNILTAISVGRNCAMIDYSHCFVPHFMEGSYQDRDARLKWQSIDNPALELDERTLTPILDGVEMDTSLPPQISSVNNYSMAVSGDVFRWLADFGQEDVLKRMLVRTQIFARMSPDEKHALVEKLQSLDYCCGFCGDGANDCGALTAADVGISLSDAEASVAAPFTSRVFDISCVPEVIREGRAALVTSFCCFKYMSVYSSIQFISVSFLYASASNLGDFQYLFIDIFLVLPIAIFMGWTGAYPFLSRKRPTASLVSRKVLTPLLGQIALCVLIQAVGYVVVRQKTWFISPVIDTEQSNIENSENTTLFGISSFQYVLFGIVLSVGPPFRQSMRHNLPFVITIVTTSLVCIYLLLDPADWLARLMQFTPMPLNFKVFILILVSGGFACSWFGERKIFPQLASKLGSLRSVLQPSWRKQRKTYKVVLESTYL